MRCRRRAGAATDDAGGGGRRRALVVVVVRAIVDDNWWWRPVGRARSQVMEPASEAVGVRTTGVAADGGRCCGRVRPFSAWRLHRGLERFIRLIPLRLVIHW